MRINELQRHECSDLKPFAVLFPDLRPALCKQILLIDFSLFRTALLFVTSASSNSKHHLSSDTCDFALMKTSNGGLKHQDSR